MPGPLPFGASARLVEEEESGNPPGGMVADGGRVSQRCAAGGNPGGELDRQQPVAELHAAFSSSDNPQQSLNTVKTVSGLCQTR